MTCTWGEAAVRFAPVQTLMKRIHMNPQRENTMHMDQANGGERLVVLMRRLLWGLLLTACLPVMAAKPPVGLRGVLQRIAAQSPAIQAAQASQRAAGAQERKARAAWFGKIDVYARSMHYNDPRLIRPITQPPNVALYPFARNQFGDGVQVQLPIDINGEILASVKAARANANRARWGAQDQRLLTLLDGAALYRNLQALSGQRQALEAQKSALDRSLAVARKSLRVGQIAKVSLLRVQAAAAAVQGQLAGVEGQQQHLRAQLAALMDLPDYTAAIELPADPPQNLPQGRFTHAPLYAQAQSAVAAATAHEQAARRAQWPQLALVGSWDRNSIQFNRRAVNTWQVMLVLKVNLWSGGAQRAAIDSASALREVAGDRARQVRLNLAAAQAGATAAWNAQSKAYAAATAGLKAAMDSARIERDRFRLGLGSATDLIDAEAALAHARSALTNALAAWWEADDALRYAYGEPPRALRAPATIDSSPFPAHADLLLNPQASP